MALSTANFRALISVSLMVTRKTVLVGDTTSNLALSKEDFKNSVETSCPEKFFRGETIAGEKRGWTAVMYNGFPIGWGKCSDGIIKNHFPKYLRF